MPSRAGSARSIAASKASHQLEEEAPPVIIPQKVYLSPMDTYETAPIGKAFSEAGFDVAGTYNTTIPSWAKDGFMTRKAIQLQQRQKDGESKISYDKLVEEAEANAQEYMLEADIIVFLLPDNEALVRGALDAMRLAEDFESKMFIAVTTPLTWAKTDVHKVAKEFQQPPPPTAKSLPSQETVSADPADPTAISEEQPVEEELAPEPVPVLSDRDEPRRNSSPRWRRCLEAERIILRARKTHKMQTYVVCPGVLYGNGETDAGFNGLFRVAWEGAEAGLPLFGPGTNYVPTIHVDDMAQYVVCLAQTRPPDPYILACDQPPSQLRDLTRSVGRAFGNETLRELDMEEIIATQNISQLLVDLPFRPSACLSPHLRNPLGMQGCSDALRLAFTGTRNLTPVRVLLFGAPGSGKSYYAEKLAYRYSLPVISAKKLVTEILPAQSQEFQDEVAAAAEALKLENPEGLEPVYSGGPRIPDEYMVQLARFALDTANCQNQGFIFNGFPCSHEVAKVLFSEMAPQTPEEAEEYQRKVEEYNALMEKIKKKGKKKGKDPDPEPVPDPPRLLLKQYVPNVVIKLEVTSEEANKRVYAVDPDERENTKLSDVAFETRWQKWVENDGGDMLKFFENPTFTTVEEEKVPIPTFTLDAEENINSNIMNVLDTFTEHIGPAKNFFGLREETVEVIPTEEELAEQERLRVLEEQRVQRAITRAQHVTRLQDMQRVEAKRKLDHEVSSRARPVVRALLTKMMPQITDGLMAICKHRPEDPIDFLSEYLREAAYKEVPLMTYVRPKTFRYWELPGYKPGDPPPAEIPPEFGGPITPIKE